MSAGYTCGTCGKNADPKYVNAHGQPVCRACFLKTGCPNCDSLRAKLSLAREALDGLLKWWGTPMEHQPEHMRDEAVRAYERGLDALSSLGE